MSYATVNDVPASAVALTEVRNGRWTASVSVPDGAVSADGVARVRIAELAEWVGRFEPGASEVVLDTLVASVRGGQGDVARAAQPRHYRFTTVGQVLADLAADAGEALAPDIDAGLMATPLQMHSVLAVSVSVNIKMLLSRVSAEAVWRFTQSGLLWVGVDAFRQTEADVEVILRSPLEMSVRMWGDDREPPHVGESFSDRRIGTAEHRVSDGGYWTTVFFEQLAAGDDIKGALQRFIKATAPFDFAVAYAAEVKAQAADGTFDVQLADARLSEHSRVRARWAYPGVVARVATGTRCTLEFEDGDAGKPIITGFDATGLIELRLGAESAVGQEVVDALLKGTAYRAREKTLFTSLATKLSAAAVQLAASATALGPTPGAPGAAGLTAASASLTEAAGELTSFEADAVAAGDWLSAKLRLK